MFCAICRWLCIIYGTRFDCKTLEMFFSNIQGFLICRHLLSLNKLSKYRHKTLKLTLIQIISIFAFHNECHSVLECHATAFVFSLALLQFCLFLIQVCIPFLYVLCRIIDCLIISSSSHWNCQNTVNLLKVYYSIT